MIRVPSISVFVRKIERPFTSAAASPSDIGIGLSPGFGVSLGIGIDIGVALDTGIARATGMALGTVPRGNRSRYHGPAQSN